MHFTKRHIIALGTFALASISLMAAVAFAEEKNEITSVDSVFLDKTGKLRFSYTVGGGCEKHEAHVEIDFQTEESAGRPNTVRSGKVQIFDSSQRPDTCTGFVRVEGQALLSDLLQKTADAKGFLIEDRRVPISTPNVSVFTGK